MAFGNGPRLVTTGLDLLVDAADQQSYPGSGTVWRDLRSGVTGSLTGSVSFTTEFYGGLTFSNSSSAVIFPSTTANYGSGSFTVEMAFKPTYINGRHYLMSKNSGSFPNWAIYLSGSAGAGKLWSEFRISSTVSCSVSSSTTFVTGSVYQVDVRILPGDSASGIYVNGQTEGGVLGNGGGTLTSTASLFVGNFSQNNTQNFSGSIYTIKTYLQASTEQPVINYNATSTRFSKPPVPETAKRRYEILAVAGGGGGGTSRAGGGGAGGLQYISTAGITPGKLTIVVGNSGSAGGNGQNSVLGSYISFGGGAGGNHPLNPGLAGGSGGGGGAYEASYGVYNNLGGTGSAGQGNKGGDAAQGGQMGGGGGGAGSAGGGISGSSSQIGFGGSGSYIASFATIGGSPAGWFAGGGGGSAQYGGTAGRGGIGGGGDGQSGTAGGGGLTAQSGSANTGGGGGGVEGAPGKAGGSGIVAVRYNGTPIAIGGEITQSAGFTYHVFRTVGTSSFTIF
jgi:hypothetical protein